MVGIIDIFRHNDLSFKIDVRMGEHVRIVNEVINVLTNDDSFQVDDFRALKVVWFSFVSVVCVSGSAISVDIVFCHHDSKMVV